MNSEDARGLNARQPRSEGKLAAVKVAVSVSLDGYVAGPNPSMDEPLGEGGDRLPEWALASLAWREQHGIEGGERNADSDVLAEHHDRTGATAIGRKMFSGGSGAWEDDPNASGWWGEEPPFAHPVFVLTHHAREPLELGATTRGCSPGPTTTGPPE